MSEEYEFIISNSNNRMREVLGRYREWFTAENDTDAVSCLLSDVLRWCETRTTDFNALLLDARRHAAKVAEHSPKGPQYALIVNKRERQSERSPLATRT